MYHWDCSPLPCRITRDWSALPVVGSQGIVPPFSHCRRCGKVPLLREQNASNRARRSHNARERGEAGIAPRPRPTESRVLVESASPPPRATEPNPIAVVRHSPRHKPPRRAWRRVAHQSPPPSSPPRGAEATDAQTKLNGPAQTPPSLRKASAPNAIG